MIATLYLLYLRLPEITHQMCGSFIKISLVESEIRLSSPSPFYLRFPHHTAYIFI